LGGIKLVPGKGRFLLIPFGGRIGPFHSKKEGLLGRFWIKEDWTGIWGNFNFLINQKGKGARLSNFPNLRLQGQGF